MKNFTAHIASDTNLSAITMQSLIRLALERDNRDRMHHWGAKEEIFAVYVECEDE